MYKELGFDCTNYINDFGGAEVPSHSACAFCSLNQLFQSLNLEASPDKDCPPSTQMTFLGVLIDTHSMTMSVTPERLSELTTRCQEALSAKDLTQSDLKSLLGVMSFVTACVRPARIFFNGLLNALRENSDSRNIRLTSDMITDLQWWCTFFPFFSGSSIIKSGPWLKDPIFLSTDACSSGAGSFFNGSYFHRPFPGSIISRFGTDINTLKLFTVMVAFKIWGSSLSGQRFVLHCDNQNSVVALNSGRSRARMMQACLREIWFLSATHDFEVRAAHIPGNDNRIADHLSRWHLHPSHKTHFEQLTSGLHCAPINFPSELFEFQFTC